MQKQPGRERVREMTKKAPGINTLLPSHIKFQQLAFIGLMQSTLSIDLDAGSEQESRNSWTGTRLLINAKAQSTCEPKQRWSTWVLNGGGCQIHGTSSLLFLLQHPILFSLLKPSGKPWLPTHMLPAQCHPLAPQPILCTTMGFTYTSWLCSYPRAPSAWGEELNSGPTPQVAADVLPRTAGYTPVKTRT